MFVYFIIIPNLNVVPLSIMLCMSFLLTPVL